MRILVSAFGNYEFPNNGGADPTTCGKSLADFVKTNNLDGAVADWEDNGALKNGKGEKWLIDFTKAYRANAPEHILAHIPQASYFSPNYATAGGYIEVNNQVGDLIDFYIVEYYNQNNTKYDSYTELFTKTTQGDFTGTSVQ